MNLSYILEQIEHGSIALPTFQRGYVWYRKDVRELMRSLYRRYPVGGLLMWKTLSNRVKTRGAQPHSSEMVTLLLDGQQRITTLYGIIRGRPPEYFDGDSSRFLNLYFSLETEEFEFYQPIRMRDDPLWINVTELFQKGAIAVGTHFFNHPDASLQANSQNYLERLNAVEKIKERPFHVDNIDGVNMPVSRVVEIFNAVNSSGTELSQGDLALAKIGADWPEARAEMRKRLAKWEAAGYAFDYDWLLRCINAILTGHSDFEELSKPENTPQLIQDGLKRAERQIDTALNLIGSRLGLADKSVLRSPNSIPAIVRFLDNETSLPSYKILDRLLYWYVHTILWGRYSGSTETVMRQDLIAINENDDPVTGLIERVRLNRGHLRVEPHDFDVATSRSRFFPMLYMMTRVYGSRDFDSGVELKNLLLGSMNRLERHHLFPKALLSKQGFSAVYERNALANFTFLTKITNLQISARKPVEYFAEVEEKHPGVLSSHWIPEDPVLWKVENYRDFLASRRALLADAANSFLNQLLHGTIPDSPAVETIVEREISPVPASVASAQEEAELNEMMDWMEAKGLPRGEFGFELVDGESNEVSAVLDLAWPRGIQEGLSKPVALLLDESEETLEIANSRDFRYFTSSERLKSYVLREIINGK
ncbi:MAG: DUF262 domain-containing protein [Chloroflexi bacterium]|nr:DUF262 domain-containing protein [Chloroflexota bacterium]